MSPVFPLESLPTSLSQTLEIRVKSRVKTGRPAQGQRGGTGRRHRYLSGPAGCIWPAARPGALGARRPSCALLSAASGAPPSPAAPQGPRGPWETRAAPGRRQPAPPSARTSTRRYSWLRRAKRSACERKGGAAACSRGASGHTGYRKGGGGLSPNPRSPRPARRVQASGLATRSPEPGGHRTRVRAHIACLLGEPHPVPVGRTETLSSALIGRKNFFCFSLV